jgi:hypothetical protein
MKSLSTPAQCNVPNQRTRRLLVGLALTFLCTLGTSLSMSGTVSAETGQPIEKTDANRLEGRWLRPDGGYVLELGEVRKDGTLMATYFNPRPIKVFRATWKRKEGKLNLFVELRDVNYPGSKYNLRYDPASDRLKGTYFQAVEKQTYDIEFIRIK